MVGTWHEQKPEDQEGEASKAGSCGKVLGKPTGMGMQQYLVILTVYISLISSDAENLSI